MTTITRRNPLAQQVEVTLSSETRPGVSHLPPHIIKANGATQMRAGLNPDTVAEYADAMREGAQFPPIILYFDGTDYWPGDGFHRLAAHKQARPNEDVAAEVRAGTRRDAVLCAVAANATHGLRRTNADKRRAVETLLRDEEWASWSDREIARRCHVGAPLVAQVRSEVVTVRNYSESDDAPTERTYTTKHGTVATMNVGGRQRTKIPLKTPEQIAAQKVTTAAPAQKSQGYAIGTQDSGDAVERANVRVVYMEPVPPELSDLSARDLPPVTIRNQIIDRLIWRLLSALEGLGEAARITGKFQAETTARRGLDELIEALKGNKIP